MCKAPNSAPQSHLPCQGHAKAMHICSLQRNDNSPVESSPLLTIEKTQIAIPTQIATDQSAAVKNQSSISPKETRFTTRTLCSSGTNLKFTNCTPGQTIQFFAKAVPYALFNLSVGLEPSMIAILLKKTNMCVVANTHWSARTRATIVRFSFRKVIFCWRNLYQTVAAGPKTAMRGRWIVSDSYSLPQTSLWVLHVLGREWDATDLLRTRPFVLFLRNCAYPALLFRLFVVP